MSDKIHPLFQTRGSGTHDINLAINFLLVLRRKN